MVYCQLMVENFCFLLMEYNALNKIANNLLMFLNFGSIIYFKLLFLGWTIISDLYLIQ